MNETKVDNRGTTQDLIHGELRSIHSTLERIYEEPSEPSRIIPHLEKIGEHIIHHLASIDERLCEANGLLYGNEIKPEQQKNLDNKRLEILRNENYEMRVILKEVYSLAEELTNTVYDRVGCDIRNVIQRHEDYPQ